MKKPKCMSNDCKHCKRLLSLFFLLYIWSRYSKDVPDETHKCMALAHFQRTLAGLNLDNPQHHKQHSSSSPLAE